MNPPTPAPKHLPGLDVVRALAVSLVVLFHVYQTHVVLVGLPHALLAFGWVGVPLFFTLSGFLVGGHLLEAVRAGTFRPGRFYLDRSLRIFPVAWVYLVVVGLLCGTLGANVWTAANFTYSSVLFGVSGPWHFWSLQTEELFYTLAPLAVLAWLGRRAVSEDQELKTLLALTVAAWLFRIVRLVLFPYDHAPTSGDVTAPYYQAWNYVDFFFLGALAARLRTLHGERIRATVTRYLPRPSLAFSLAGVVLALAFREPTAMPDCIPDYIFAAGLPLLSLWSFAVVLWFSLFRATSPVAGAEAATRTKGSLVSRAVQTVARLSYSIYVWHWLLLRALEGLGVSSFAAQLVLGVGGSLVAAQLSYLLVERPFLALRSKLRAAVKGRATVEASTEALAA